jgi:hypothetical protein
MSAQNKELLEAVTRADPIAESLWDRAIRSWWEPLRAKNWHLPPFLVFDLGILLLRPEALVRSSSGETGLYAEALARVAGHERFRMCSRLIARCSRERQDGAIRVAIEAITRQVRAVLAKEKMWEESKWNAPACVRLVGQVLASVLERAEDLAWLTEVDLLAVWAASERTHGERSLDYGLLDRCLCQSEELPRHRLCWRRIPTRRLGPKDISRLPGETVGYTSLRSRLPGDEWHEVLPTEWAFFQESELLGLDKLLNRQPLVYRRETPHDLVPHLRVLLVSIVDAWGGSAGTSWRDTANAVAYPRQAIDLRHEGKALLFRMVQDLAQQIPREHMVLEMAVFLRAFESNYSLVVSGFHLDELATSSDRFEQVLRFNEIVPNFFYSCNLANGRRYGSTHVYLPEDPYVLLNIAASSANYSGVFALVISYPGRWARILPRIPVQVRAPDAVRPALLLVETHGRDSYGIAIFHDFAQAQVASAGKFSGASAFDARMTLLGMLLGPQPKGKSLWWDGKADFGVPSSQGISETGF